MPVSWKRAESLRQTRVRREADELSRQVEEINALAAEVDEAVNGDDGDDRDSLSAEFIGRYRAMATGTARTSASPPPSRHQRCRPRENVSRRTTDPLINACRRCTTR